MFHLINHAHFRSLGKKRDHVTIPEMMILPRPKIKTKRNIKVLLYIGENLHPYHMANFNQDFII